MRRAATIAALCLVASAPAILSGLPPGHDHLLHLTWYAHFADQLWKGDLRPRWLFGMNAGFGSPTFFFYGPTPYYITSVFRPVFGASDPAGWRAAGLSAALAVLLSGLGANGRRAGADARARDAALLGAIAYVILPYHLATDLYARAAFAELWALAWVPWVLFAARRCADREERSALAGLALASALLITTHLPTSLLVLGVPIVESLATAAPSGRAAAARRTSLGLALGAGLSAAYWLPALANRSEVHARLSATDPRYFAKNFLFGATAGKPFAEFTRSVQTVTALAVVLSAMTFAAVLIALREPAARAESPGDDADRGSRLLGRAAGFWAALSILALLMMLPVSRALWSLLAPLQAIQFPWRFNTLLLSAAAALVTLAVLALLEAFRSDSPPALLAARGPLVATTAPRRATVGFLALLATIAVGVLIAGASLDVRAAVQSQGTRRALDGEAEKRAIGLGMDNGDLRPSTARREMFGGRSVGALLSGPRGALVVDGAGSVSISRWGPRDIALIVDAPVDLRVGIDQFYYWGWSARARSLSRPLAVSPAPPWGLTEIRVPAGATEVVMTPTAGPLDRIGSWLSVLSVAALLVALLRPARGAPRIPRRV